MADYWDHHARVDLDDYVAVRRRRPRRPACPVVLGLEVDYYRGRMDDVADLLDGYPFDVLLGSVHWLGDLALRRPGRPRVDGRVGPPGRSTGCWDEYTAAMEELARLGGVRRAGPSRPDQGRRARSPTSPTSSGTGSPRRRRRRGWPPSCRRPAGASRWGSSTRRRRCCERFVARGVPLTTASDAHRLPRRGRRADDLRGCWPLPGVDPCAGSATGSPDVPVSSGGRPPVRPAAGEG